jgi:large subunit ribosomal protein L15e
MGLAKYLREVWRSPDNSIIRPRMIEWRKSDSIVKVEKPLNLARARALGYKAKKGVVVVRVRIVRGGHKRTRPKKGRRTKRMTPRKNLTMNYQEIAEQRVSRKYVNMEVLNSYQVGKDGMHYFYEVILVDPSKKEIQNDKQLSFIGNPASKKRAIRGLTSAGKKARGLRSSTSKAPKVRPSLRAHGRKGN